MSYHYMRANILGAGLRRQLIEKEKLREEIEQEGKFKAPVWAGKQKGFSKGVGTSQQRPETEGFRGSRGPCRPKSAPCD